MIIWLTGCTAGLGRALVSEFTLLGHTVVGGGRSKSALAELRDEFPNSHFLSIDVADDTSAHTFCEAAVKLSGSPDLLINNAAVINHPAPLWQVSAEEFDQLTAININGTVNMIRHSVPHMISNTQGIIVNLSSGWGRGTSPEVAPYCASKWAIEGLTQSLAQELPSGLAAIALSPGVINTEMLQTVYGEDAQNHRGPEEWASTAAPFLCSLTASQNGQSLTAP